MNNKLDPKTLVHEDVKFLLRFYNPVLRKLMKSSEIKEANKFVKKGWLVKGKSISRPHTVIYYIERYLALEIINSNPEQTPNDHDS